MQVDIVPRLFELIGPKVDIHAVEGLPLLGLAPLDSPRSSRLVKRAIDLVGASVALALFAPLFAVIAVLIRRDGDGPVFFRQARLGQDMRSFTMLKFRTMRADTDRAAHRAYIKATASADAALQGTGLYKLDQADVVTRVGGWLRKTSLDELPQLLNVLRGDMSLVGPRPCLAVRDRALPAAPLRALPGPARAHRALAGQRAGPLDVRRGARHGRRSTPAAASVGLDLRLLMRTPLELMRSEVTA